MTSRDHRRDGRFLKFPSSPKYPRACGRNFSISCFVWCLKMSDLIYCCWKSTKKTCCCGSKSLFGCLKSPCFMFPPHPKWFAVDLRPSWNCTSPCRACNSWLPPRLPPRDWKRLPSNYWNNLTIGVSILYYSIIVNKYPMIQIFGNNYWNTINNLYHCIRMNSGYTIEPYAKPRCQNMFCSSAHGEFPSKKTRGILTEGSPELASNSPLVIKRGNQKSP